MLYDSRIKYKLSDGMMFVKGLFRLQLGFES